MSAGRAMDERFAANEPRGALFRPLGRDYWPPETRRPFLRAALALIAAPLTLAATLGAAAWAVALFDAGAGMNAGAYAYDTFLVMAQAFFGPEFWPATIGFFALWSLRMRSRGAYVAAAVATGAAGWAIAALRLDAQSGAVALAIVLLHLAYLQLVARFAGVRGAPPPQDDE